VPGKTGGTGLKEILQRGGLTHIATTVKNTMATLPGGGPQEAGLGNPISIGRVQFAKIDANTVAILVGLRTSSNKEQALWVAGAAVECLVSGATTKTYAQTEFFSVCAGFRTPAVTSSRRAPAAGV
jgi:hypothetical protein